MAQEASPTPEASLPARPVRSPGATPSLLPTPLPTPTPAPTARAVPSAAAPTTRSLIAENEVIPLIDYPGTDISEVLGFYEQLTGKKVLYDNTVQGKIRVHVTNVYPREAVRILETVFALNGFTLIPGPGDIVKVISANKNPRQFSIPILSDVCQLPENNQVVSFLFKLEYADPADVKNALTEIIANTPNITSIVALPKSQAVLLTEYSDVIRNMAPIVAKLDSKPAEVVSEFFQLQRADAKEVVERLTKMFEKTPGAPGTPLGLQVPDGNKGNAAASGPVTLSEDALIVGKIKIDADLRTNRIQVVTRPVNLPFLRTLIAELDSSLPLGEPATRPLRFVLAGDVLDIVAGSVAEPGVEVKKLEASRSGGGANPVSNTSGTLGATSSSRNSSSRNPSGINPGSFNSGASAGQADTAPEGRIIRNTKIIADNRINAIIVVGNEEMKKKVFKLLDQIDVRAPQVMLTAVIGELTLDNNEEFGIDYLFNRGNIADVIGSSGSSLAISGSGIAGVNIPGMGLNGISLKNLISVASLPGASGATGVTGLIGVTNSFDVIVNLLQSTGRFRVTSRPMIFTSNNRPAVISSGESIPVPGTINSSYNNSNNLVSTANVDYIDVALRLSVLPLINSEGEVTLKITQEANNTSGATVISGNSIPTVTTRSIDTTVSVANEATIVLGGLVSEQKQTTKSGIPYLHRLPIVGPLFGSTKKTLSRTELIVLIRPTVTNGPVEAIKAGEKAMERTNFPPDLEASLDPTAARVKKDVPNPPPKPPFAPLKALLRPEQE